MRTHPKLTALAAVIVLASAALAGAGTDKPMPPGQMKHYDNSMDSAAMKLRMDMRRLWEDHVAYTRNYLISATSNLPDKQVVAERLLRNQDDIGNAIQPYYGDAAAKKLSGLLRDHIMIATEVVKAAQAGDKTALATQQQKWTANGNSIAAFLAGANPNWSKVDLERMMQMHLDLLTKQVAARLNKDWSAELRAYDEGHDHILKMADALSDGIAKQFPAKFQQAAN